MRTAIRLLVGVISCTAVPATVDAQIYAWRDGSGTLFLSDRPLSKDAEVQSGAVRRKSAVGMTRLVSATRAASYDDLIQHHSADQGIRADLVRAVIQAESAFDPWARSIKGAMGLMQIMPATAREFGVLNPYDPAENIRAGVQYLRRLLDRYSNNEELALAAYNAGPKAVDRHGAQVPPYRETRGYVAKIRRTTGVSRSTRIYRTIEFIDGREVPRYTNVKPTAGVR